MASALVVQGDRASWPRPWATFLTQIWQAVTFGWFWNAKTVDDDYDMSPTDTVVFINGDITVTLPSVKLVGPKRITVKIINGGGGTRTVDGNGVNIDGSGSVTSTTQYDAWDFVNDGNQYYIA